jgi:hypothetical protein
LAFHTFSGTKYFRAVGDCCSSSWFENISGYNNLIGSQILKTDYIDINVARIENSDYGECIQVYGYKVVGDHGDFLIEMRNSSNGYYGGYIKEEYNVTEKLILIKEDF